MDVPEAGFAALLRAAVFGVVLAFSEPAFALADLAGADLAGAVFDAVFLGLVLAPLLAAPDFAGAFAAVDFAALDVAVSDLAALDLAAPDFAPDGPLTLEALRRLPLLHIQTRPDAWARWFVGQGMVPGPLPGPTFDQFTAILQAALHGLGVALIPDYLSIAERASGVLRPVSTAEPVSLGAYYLVWPADRAPPPALRSFRDWLATQTDEDETLPR